MVSEDIIKEAASRGIVPGATIRCADHSDCEGIGVVSEYHKWRNESFGYVVCGTDQEDDELYAKTGDGQWAEVMENTKPPVKELTTEEKLAEAMRLLGDFVKYTHVMNTRPNGSSVYNEALAFLKSIKP